MWGTGCSVWRSPSRLWTAAWGDPAPATWTPCALTCTSRVLRLPLALPQPLPLFPARSGPPPSLRREAGWCLPPPGCRRPLQPQLLRGPGGVWGPGSRPRFALSALCCPAGARGLELGAMPGAEGPLSGASGLSSHSRPHSWASICASWAGWPTARLRTPSSSLRQAVAMGGRASSAWARGRTCQSAGMPTATASKVRPLPPGRVPSRQPATHRRLPRRCGLPVQRWPRG